MRQTIRKIIHTINFYLYEVQRWVRLTDSNGNRNQDNAYAAYSHLPWMVYYQKCHLLCDHFWVKALQFSEIGYVSGCSDSLE